MLAGIMTSAFGGEAVAGHRKKAYLKQRTVHLFTNGVERASALTDSTGHFELTGNSGTFGDPYGWTVDAKKTKRFKCLAGSLSAT